MARILIVDDDISMDLVADDLRWRGSDAERLGTLEPILKEPARFARDYDLIILDMIIPAPEGSACTVGGYRSAGMLAYTALRKCRPSLPLLILSVGQESSIGAIVKSDPSSRYVSKLSLGSLTEIAGLADQMLGRAPSMPRPFIVHGHDHAAKLELKDFLQNSLQLPEPIILSERPDLGRTLIEKLEAESAEVDLAFVLLTPDDCAHGQEGPPNPRARQNVILELGFFLGLFRRRAGRVFLLYKGALELPSDLDGVIYINVDQGVASAGEKIRLNVQAAIGHSLP